MTASFALPALARRPLAAALLLTLAEEAPASAVSLPRLSKRLGQGVSVLLRELTLMGDAVLAGQPGPGWVRVWEEEGRWRVVLTDAGRGCAEQVQAALGAA